VQGDSLVAQQADWSDLVTFDVTTLAPHDSASYQFAVLYSNKGVAHLQEIAASIRPPADSGALVFDPYWLRNYTGVNTSGIPDINDNGYQLWASAMVVPQALQLYIGGSQIFGDYGKPSEVRVGENWYFLKKRGLRLNGELAHVNHSPVGYTAYPYPVGGNGNVVNINLEMNF